MEAAGSLDRKVIGHCSKHGLEPDGYCLDATMTAKASLADRLDFAKFLLIHGLKEGIGSMCAKSLVCDRDEAALLFLLERRLLSTGALRQIIRYATRP